MTQHSHVLYRVHGRALPTISHGNGIALWDTEGKRYLDASGGAVVVNVGHGVVEIAEAMRAQATRVAYAHPTMFTSDAVEQLAQQLAAHLPLPCARLFFVTSGSEAVETAIKLTRQIQIARGEASRYQVISRWASYHGATLGALALTGKPAMRRWFEPLLCNMPHIPPPYCYRCYFGLTYPQCTLRCADALEDAIKQHDASTIAAFIGEPIGGATLGAVVPPHGYWQRIREICNQYHILLITDEVMTGIGRTGHWFASEPLNVCPDIVCMGKGITSGYAPLGATAARGDLIDLLWEVTGEFNHGGTFSHHTVAAAAGLATLQYIVRHDLIARAETMGTRLGKLLHATFDAHPHVGDIRGQGMLWALEFVANRSTRAPFPISANVARRVFQTALANGLIVYAMNGCADGIAGDHVMIAPPFIVTEQELEEIVNRLRIAIDAALQM